MTTAHDICSIIEGKTGKEEISVSHEELKSKLKELEREVLEDIALKLAYSVTILREKEE